MLDYELMIYHCEGTGKERLKWFEVINIAGEKLTPQELRNAVYTGPWLSDAKLKFSNVGLFADYFPISQLSQFRITGGVFLGQDKVSAHGVVGAEYL